MKSKKDEDIVCGICKLVIDLNKEFCEFIHFDKKDSIKSIGFYHINCFRERMSGGNNLKALQEQAKRILDKAEMRIE